MLVRKLDEMGTKISATIASELMGICADVDRMNTLHKASTDIFLAQLHGMTDPTKVTGPSTIDTTTPSPTDGLKLTFQTPPTPTPHLPPRDDGIPKGPPKGSFSPTKPMSRGNSRPTYIGQSPRTPPWHFSTPPGRNPRGPPGPPNPGGGDGGGGPGGGPGRGPGRSQAETMTEDHPTEDHPAEDHPAEGHQENLLETPQKETNQGETTLGMTTNLTTRIQITIRRTTRTEAIPLHQGEVQPPQATIGTSSIPQCGGLIHPGQEPRAKECWKSATTPSVNAFTKPLRTQLATYSDGRQSPLAPTHT